MARQLSATAREKMLAATLRLLYSGGFDAVTVDAVAGESGVAKTTIYRHFPSANELLVAAIGQLVDDVPSVDTGSVRTDLITLLGQYLRTAQRPEMYCAFTSVLQRASVDDEFARLHAAFVAERKAPIRMAIQRGISRGEIDPTIDLEVIASLVEGPVIARVVHDRGEFREHEIEQIVDLVLTAVRPVSDRPAAMPATSTRTLGA